MQEYRVTIDANGTQRWYNKDNELHREDDQPAVIYTDGDRFWYLNNNLHRENGPAVIYYNGTEEYWVNGVLQPNPNEFKELTVADIEKILGYRIKVVK
jgi:hypothetical protein